MKVFKSTAAFIETLCLWVAVTSIGWLVGYSLIRYLADRTSTWISEEIIIVISVICGGCVVALVQWQYLEPKVSGIASWVGISACGLALGFAITSLAIGLTGSLFGAILGSIVGGFAVGIIQSFGLRSGARDKTIWILVTDLGWALACVLGILIFSQGDIAILPNSLQEVIVAWTLGSMVLSLVTVFALVLLFPGSMVKDPRTPVKWSFINY